MRYKKPRRACEYYELMKPGVGFIKLHTRTSLKKRVTSWLEVRPEGYEECFHLFGTSSTLESLVLAETATELHDICIVLMKEAQGEDARRQ